MQVAGFQLFDYLIKVITSKTSKVYAQLFICARLLMENHSMQKKPAFRHNDQKTMPNLA
jgi:hypothetical protein